MTKVEESKMTKEEDGETNLKFLRGAPIEAFANAILAEWEGENGTER